MKRRNPKTIKELFRVGASVGFRTTGHEIASLQYDGPRPSMWSGYVYGPFNGTHVPVYCDRLGGIEATTIMVAATNIETVDGQSFPRGRA